MTGKLPPLNTLRLFEAAGRHLNFKLAAEEHHVTPSAVSHGIRTLEDWLGTELFHRTRAGLVLTRAGAQYLPSVRDALTGLAHATARIPGRTASGELSISVAPTFATRWLIPRLHRFAEISPDVVVSIDTAPHRIDLPSDQVDLAIRMAPEACPGATWLELTRISLIPVCTPDFLTKITGTGGKIDLTDVPLIRVTAGSEDWETWFEMAGLEAPRSKGDIKVDTIELAIQAALRGLGVTLGRRPLVDAELENGNLVQLMGSPRQSRISYWLVGTDLTLERPETKQFRRWLIQELAGAEPLGASHGAEWAIQDITRKAS